MFLIINLKIDGISDFVTFDQFVCIVYIEIRHSGLNGCQNGFGDFADVQILRMFQNISFVMAQDERTLILQFYKNFLDDISIEIKSPMGLLTGKIQINRTYIEGNLGQDNYFIYNSGPKPFDINGEEFEQITKFAEENNLPIFIHIFSSKEANKLIKIARKYVNTNFIIAHLMGLENFIKRVYNKRRLF